MADDDRIDTEARRSRSPRAGRTRPRLCGEVGPRARGGAANSALIGFTATIQASSGSSAAAASWRTTRAQTPAPRAAATIEASAAISIELGEHARLQLELQCSLQDRHRRDCERSHRDAEHEYAQHRDVSAGVEVAHDCARRDPGGNGECQSDAEIRCPASGRPEGGILDVRRGSRAAVLDALSEDTG